MYTKKQKTCADRVTLHPEVKKRKAWVLPGKRDPAIANASEEMLRKKALVF